ncbi:MAG: 23S rRNA (pseudouridine(1915)-N(3))-methyltransferase RlmH [Burkholderiales bacterium]|nr:23S rRNA (pseudouridine(1915)-N(3))-methyltransferase RlmH [Burkholderiales bacterium]
MKLIIINVANKMPLWVSSACEEYLKRINFGKYSCKLIEIKAAKNPNKPTSEIMKEEAQKIKPHIPDGSFVIALDERGKQLNSIKFAGQLDWVSLHYKSIVFIIGGADGIDEDLKQSANLIMQLSHLTFPHAIVRVILLEQIYRALTILTNHPYHRE